jgi:hypothetical protein
MVVRLWGTCQGTEIGFTRTEGERWTTTVPASANGTYIIELWAEDAAGNVGYFATVKITFDPSTLCMKLEISDVGELWSIDEVRRVLSGVESDNILSKITRCEVCEK